MPRPVNSGGGEKEKRRPLLMSTLAPTRNAKHRTNGPFALHTSGHPVRSWVFGPEQNEGPGLHTEAMEEPPALVRDGHRSAPAAVIGWDLFSVGLRTVPPV